MNQYRYTLEPYKGMKTRHTCPSCGERKKFKYYIDTTTGEPIHPTVGKCNRADNCGYHYTPKEYFEANNIGNANNFAPTFRPAFKPEPPPSYIAPDVVKDSMKNYNSNNFVQFLIAFFGIETVQNLINKYPIGTSKQWSGANIFWQLDINGKVRTGKIMLYDATTGKRAKDKFNWVHSLLNTPDFNLQQCFYGERLLHNNTKKIGIVESEKTAIICSVYYPDIVWIATGGKGNLHKLLTTRAGILANRNVILYPDLGLYSEWNAIAMEYGYSTSSVLEREFKTPVTHAKLKIGDDLADYLLQFEPPKATLATDAITNAATDAKPTSSTDAMQYPDVFNDFLSRHDFYVYATTSNHAEPPAPAMPYNWTNKLVELKVFFECATLPKNAIKLPFGLVTDVSLFVTNHLSFCENNTGTPKYHVYLDRLIVLKNYLTESI